MNKLLKDAIADAKAVRETALANAKLALEEAFAPKLQSMLSSKIREEMEEEEPAEEPEMEGMYADNNEEEVNMESRFKSLAGISEEEGEEESEEDFSDESEEDYSDEGGEGESEEDFSDEGEGEEDFSDESDEDLEEILRELDAEDGEETEAPAEDEEMDLEEIINALREEEGEEEASEESEEEVDLQELLNSLNEEEEEEEEKVEEGKMKMKKKMNKMEEELNEAYSAVKFLRTKLSEVNLLNAKLLYVNKLFRNNLTETQKVKIIETFDRAKTVREAKLVYATLSESITAAKGSTKQNATKKSVMEGLASKATAKTKSVLSEGTNQANRFKKLAGII
ncbi:hypothetical protein UFOVP450_184 [uncultured Caudovirales phage]|uniref:Uncharacterized protein n=1 Tax=uncultured Caudovirales phage TaxID=2100421 RepID=A0A6J5MEZ9_9CAUD|nr:hypothetical protein UFOVP450_184 [uncultured Caudovirales phage]